MNAYFFKMTNEERKNILDQHKDLYDGYVTRYNQSNEQPLYVQDFANDKGGITVNNKGEVKSYTNMNINEDIDRRDRIGDGPTDLKGGTVDLHGQSDDYKDRSMYNPYYGDDEDDEIEYVSLGMKDDNECKHCDDDSLDIIVDFDEIGEDYEYDIDRNFSEDLAGEVDEDKVPEFMEKLNESLDMFKRFKKYN